MKNVGLTARELYFLGKYMRAKFIDYDYIAAMPDVQKYHTLHEQQALESLENKEVIEEDFSGNIEIPDEIRLLFEPVFFGKKESKLDNGDVYRIHILDNRLTMAVIEGEQIVFSGVTEEDLADLLKGTLRIWCSEVDAGACEKTYTGDQLMQEVYREEALKLLKGDN